MSKSKLVCTVELDLPDELSKAHALQAPLLAIWEQFTTALKDQKIDARADARVVKTKAPKEKPQGDGAAGQGSGDPDPNKKPEAQMPAFLRRDQ